MIVPSYAVPQPLMKPIPASVIAIVDVPRILKESTAAESVRNQIDVQRSKFQTQIGKEEEGLRKAEKELIKLRDEGKKEAFSEFEQRLRTRFLKVERHVQTRRKALDQANTDSMNAVRESLIDVVSQISKEKSINLVVVKQQVIWHDKAVDLTDAVVLRLNEKR